MRYWFVKGKNNKFHIIPAANRRGRIVWKSRCGKLFDDYQVASLRKVDASRICKHCHSIGG